MGAIERDKLDEILKILNKQDEKLSKLYQFSNETNAVVKDILLGTNVAEWIDDLETNGTSSATYKDASRMETLIATEDACLNLTITELLCSWAVDNSKAGTYFGTIIGDVSGVTWSSLTSIDTVTANSTALSSVLKNATTLDVFMNNTKCRKSLYTNYSVSADILKGMSLTKYLTKQSIYNTNILPSSPFTRNMYIKQIWTYSADNYTTGDAFTAKVTKPDGSIENIQKTGMVEDKKVAFNKMAKEIEIINADRHMGVYINYLDCQ